MKTVETAFARYTLRDDGIVMARAINPEAPRTRDTAAATLDVLAGLVGDKPRPILWDQRAKPRLAPGMWVELIERVERLAVALAIMTDESGSELSVYTDAIGTLLTPTREFSAEEPAIAWLRKYLD